MKRIRAAALLLSGLVCMSVFSACSDFAFNPIGKWEFTTMIDTDGEEYDVYEDIFSSKYHVYLVFEKSGTAYFMYDDEVASERITYTYEYDDESVTITAYDTYTDDVTVFSDYVVSDDGQTLTYTEESDEGYEIVRTYERV